MPSTCVPDAAVAKLGLLDAFLVSYVARLGTVDTPIPTLAKEIDIGRNRLRRALHRLTTAGYLSSSSESHTARSYALGPRSPEIGLPKQESQNRSPNVGLLNQQATQDRSPKTGVLNGSESEITAESEVNPGSTESSTAATSINKSSKKRKRGKQSKEQQVLLENVDAQNLGALDIEAQHDLESLGINPDIEQKHNAPLVTRGKSPAEVLMFHDPDGSISENLGRWRAAWDDGAEIKWKPTLIWWKICEGQTPPEPEQIEAEGWVYEGVLT